MLAITIKIGDVVIPHNTRIVSKKGRGNTDKPSLFIVMIQEVLDFLDAQGIDIRKYPITFDSWYGTKKLIQILLDLGFVSIAVHGPSNYVMTIFEKCQFYNSLYINSWSSDTPENPGSDKCQKLDTPKKEILLDNKMRNL